MNKRFCLFLAAALLLVLSACGGSDPEAGIRPWTRQGSFEDDNGNLLMVSRSDTEGYEGWSTTFILNGEAAGWILQQEGNALHGNLRGWDENGEPFTVTVSEEGEDGLLLTAEDGESWHFRRMDVPEATIHVSIRTEGTGSISYAEGYTAPEFDPDYPFQSARIDLAGPAEYTIEARPAAGMVFVKWMKDGKDLSDEARISVFLEESADYTAVFEEDPDWQNPVMNFVGEYLCGRAHAAVECFGGDEARITVEQGSSARELTRWIIVGRLDTETLTIRYTGASKANLVYDLQGEVQSEESVYDDGTGAVVFHDDGSFLWHEDSSEAGNDMVFLWSGAQEDPGYYSAVTALDKNAVEELCSILRTAYLNEDWETISVYIRYPISVNGTELKNSDDLLSFLQDKTVHESDRQAMDGETCHDMFFNGQGICLGSGQLWLIDLNFGTGDPPELAVIALSGITDR